MPESVTPHDFSEIRWRGHWIWVPEEPVEPSGFWSSDVDPQADESHGLFRKKVHLDRVPRRVPARVTADSRYQLYVNGQEVCRGPVRSQSRRLYYDLLDLASFLHSGENVVAIYVKYYGIPQSFWMPAVPNNTLGKTGILVFEANLGKAGWLVSDSTWRACKAGAWTDDVRDDLDHGTGVPVEVFDARRFPHGWQQAGFDDQSWGAAQVVPAMHVGGFARTQPPTDPYGPLYARPIAPLGGAVKTPAVLQVETLEGQVELAIGSPVGRVQAALGLPVSVTTQAEHLPLTLDVPAGGMVRLSFDMGQIVSGFVEFELEAPAGMVLDLSYTEEPLKLPASMDKMYAGTRYIARGEHDRFQVFDSNGFRYVYILVHGAPGSVTLEHLAVQEHLYPWS
jgi:alpha-L-rhamnosidase